ncbi:hypothetical protein INR79_09750 [Vibrio sp. SCSIO 43132]|uniref:hypothetical protein n=1 Tax=Vibrio sp. SCSIO 43132 TaxID=2779363 RepID=UPI001CA99225|nr:hypothetical protein [Vibrio sp. SCSIO 43132]UAB68831.1 hypothetical protein INR79_09750 [Vibrio sp. SCSIO 43132]
MKAIFIKAIKGAACWWEWVFNNRKHADSWRKASIFMFTLAALTFMQLMLVILPIEKDGKFNLYETVRIEQKDIPNILEYECKLDSEAYTQCSMAKYQLNNVKVLLPIFSYGTQIAFALGVLLLILSFISGIEIKEDEYDQWKKDLDKASSGKSENDETEEEMNELS